MAKAKKSTTKKTTGTTVSGPVKGKQKSIPGTEPKFDPELEVLAKNVNSCASEHGAAGAALKNAKESLLSYMQESGVKVYKFKDGDDEWIARLKEGETKVAITKAAKKTRAA